MGGPPPGLPPNHPMARFNALLTTNKGAAVLYKELLTSITSGDVDGSKEVAALLAQHAQKMNASATEASAPGPTDDAPPSAEPSRLASLDDAIPFSDESILHAAEKLRGVGQGEESPLVAQADASALRIIIIDSNFEMDEDEEVEGKAADTQMAVLDEYLRTDDAKWKTQKRAVSAMVLEAAKAAGVTPAMLIASPPSSNKSPGESTSMSPFKECNVVVRCEVPANIEGSDAAVAINKRLKEMREAGGAEWTDEADAIARREMELSTMVVRYKVGIHHSLEHALGHDMCAKFVEGAMQRLNNSDDAVLSQPTMPFTFLMRTCLWFDLEEASEAKI
jgi:hypothetical protein